MRRSWHRILIFLLVIAWLVGIISLYYAGHKPFSAQLALNIAKATGQFIVAFLIMAVAGGSGRRLMAVTNFNPLVTTVLQASLGLGILSLVILIVGSTIGITPIIGWICLALLALLLWRETLAWVRSLKSLGEIWGDSGRLGKAIGILAVLAVLVMFPVALLPPLKFDALVYHLALPRTYLEAGKVIYTPHLMYWGMPQAGEMLYTWAISLASTETSTILGWMIGILALLGMFGFISQSLGPRPAGVALAALLSSYTFVSLLPTGYIDWFVVLFGFCFMAMLADWWSSGDSRALILAGLFGGFALGSKYTAGILVIGGISAVLINSFGKTAIRARLISNLTYFLLPVIVITLPWWIKNTLATGNPFYPFFFPSGTMDQFRLDFYHLPVWGDWKDFALLPFRATISGFEGAPGYSATLSPLLLGLCPFAFLGWRKWIEVHRITILTAAVIGGAGLLAWGIAGRLSGYLIQSRLYFAVFPAYALLAGAGYQGISRLKFSSVRIGRIIGALIVLVLGFTLLQGVTEVYTRGAVQVLVGLSTRGDYLDKNLGWYYPASQAIRELPASSNVLMIGEPRGFYCYPKCVADEILDRWKHDRFIFGDEQSILASWRKAGFTHLLYNKFGADFMRKNDLRYTTEDWSALDHLIQGLQLQNDFGASYLLYSLQP